MGTDDLQLVINRIGAIIEAAKGDHLTLADKAGLYAALRFLIADMNLFIDENGIEAYGREKARSVLAQMSALLGFGSTNGHDANHHLAWALGNYDSLRSTLKVANR